MPCLFAHTHTRVSSSSSLRDATEKGGSRWGWGWHSAVSPVCAYMPSCVIDSWPVALLPPCLSSCQTVCTVCLCSAMRDKPCILLPLLLLSCLSILLPFSSFRCRRDDYGNFSTISKLISIIVKLFLGYFSLRIDGLDLRKKMRG